MPRDGHPMPEIAFDLGRRNSDNVNVWVISASGGPKIGTPRGRSLEKGPASEV